jgi:hypothetical protein
MLGLVKLKLQHRHFDTRDMVQGHIVTGAGPMPAPIFAVFAYFQRLA